MNRRLVAIVGVASVAGFAALVCGLVAAMRYAHIRRIHAALGAKAELDPSPCTVLRGNSVSLELWAQQQTIYTTIRPGVTEVDCQDDSRFSIDVREAASLSIAGPSQLHSGERVTFEAIAKDKDGGTLELGAYSPLAWEISGAAVSDNPGGCEFPPWCGSAPAGATWVRANAAGAAHVHAQLGGLGASSAVEVLPAP